MKSPIMKEIEKLAKGHEAQLQRELRKIERARGIMFGERMRRAESLKQAYDLKGEELEKRIQEIAKENGMICYIGDGFYNNEQFLKRISEMDAISFKKPSGARGSITIFPPGIKEERIRPDLPPSEVNLVVIVSPNGLYTLKRFVEEA